jgi:hypothetical protein
MSELLARIVDTGTTGTPEVVPTSEGTVWTVKNIFELKNARQVRVEHNILENHWKQAQPGWAIVFTPRNSGGGCSWCVVEDVTFQYPGGSTPIQGGHRLPVGDVRRSPDASPRATA